MAVQDNENLPDMAEKNSTVGVFDLITLFRRRLWVILMTVFAVTAVSVYVTFLLPDLYRADVTVLVEPSAYEQAAISEVVPRSVQPPVIETETDRIKTEIQFVVANPVIEAVIEELDLKDANEQPLRTIYSKGQILPLVPFPSIAVEAKQIETTQMLRVSGYARDPNAAASLANTLAKCYIESKQVAVQHQLRRALAFLDIQMLELRSAFLDGQNALRSYQEDHETVDLRREITAAVDRLVALEQLKQEHSLSLDVAKATLDPLDRELRSILSAQVVDDILARPEIIQIQQHAEDLEGGKYAPLDESAERSQEMERDKAAIQEQISQTVTLTPLLPEEVAQTTSHDLLKRYLEAKVEVDYGAARIKAVSDMIAAQQASLKSLQEKVTSITQLEMNAEVASTTYTDALQLRGTLNIAAAMQVSNVRVISPATIPDDPHSPNLAVNICAALFGGLLLGIILALIREYYDDHVKASSVVEKLLASQFIITLPGALKQLNPKSYVEDLRNPRVRAYRSLRNILWETAPDQKCRTAVVVSAVPREGRTNVCINLALSAAQAYKKVLIVDTDLQKPTLHKRFRLQQAPGLTNYLFDSAPWDQVVRPTKVPNLGIMPVGQIPIDSGSLLRSGQFHDMVKKICQEYDCVIFDTPPALIVNDVVLLARLVGTVLVVTRFGFTRARHLKALSHVFEGVGIKPAVSVVVGVAKAVSL